MAAHDYTTSLKFHLNPKEVAIGIDLGSTNSSVGVFINGAVEIITTEGSGKRTVPSYVYFDEKDGCFVGERAVAYLKTKPNHVVYDSKRMVGMNFEDSVIKRNEAFWTFKVEKQNNRPVYAIDANKKVLPEEVSAEILKELMSMAQKRTGSKIITKAVISVPAHFTVVQKEATIYSAKLAGIDTVRVITEPSATSFAYSFYHKRYNGLKLFVFDLGGGTLDVSIVHVDDGKFNVVRHEGDSQLGGRDFDNRLMDHFNTKYKLGVLENKDEKTIKRKMMFREACEEMKIRLSHVGKSHVTISLGDIVPGLADANLSYKEFKELVADLTRRCQKLCMNALEESGTKPDDIDGILIVGGSSKMRVIKEMLKDVFPNRNLSELINPYVAVVYGATLHAAQLLDPEKSEGFEIIDKISFGIGVALGENRYERLFNHDTQYPAKSEKKSYCTVFNNQSAMTFDVYEGECLPADQNYHIMSFELKGLPKKRAEEVRADLVLELDENGILTATVTSGDKIEIHKVNHNEKKAKGQQVEDMLANMEMNCEKGRETDKANADRIGLRKNIEFIKWEAEEKMKKKFKPKEIDALLKDCKEVDKWLNTHNSKLTPEIRDKFEKIEKDAKRFLGSAEPFQIVRKPISQNFITANVYPEASKSLNNINEYAIPKKIKENDNNIKAVGIDLGTTRCFAAVNRRNGIETIALDNTGERHLPSYVSFKEKKEECGQIVVSRMQQNAKFTVYDSKRIIGRINRDIIIDINWPFQITENGNTELIKVHSFSGLIYRSPEEVAAVLLKHIKQKIEEFQGKVLTEVVITVPAAFTDNQKNATIAAAILAGWKNVHLLPEPIAASIAYFIDRPIPNEFTLLLFDIGGGTLDVSVMKVNNENLHTISIGGDANLGGRDFDNILFKHFSYILKEQHQIDVEARERLKYLLLQNCMEIKHHLSVKKEDILDVSVFDTTLERTITITSHEFENMSLLLLDKIRKVIIDIFSKANLTSRDIHKILLVGGSSRMPMIKHLLLNMFTKAEHCCEENPDEVVAIGAAYYAYHLNS